VLTSWLSVSRKQARFISFSPAAKQVSDQFKVSTVYRRPDYNALAYYNKIPSYFLVYETEAPSEIITENRRMLMNSKGCL